MARTAERLGSGRASARPAEEGDDAFRLKQIPTVISGRL